MSRGVDEMETMLTVKEILERPHFTEAQVIAGEEGLHRCVRWVHVLEVDNVEQLLHGEEMILTTGIRFHSEYISFAAYLKRLIEQNVSCLCIELSEHLTSIPQDMLDTANEHQFPIIIFPNIVRFVDITQDIHSLIINRQHQIIRDLERISREFHRLTLKSQGVSNVLKLLHSSTDAQVVYFPLKGQPSFTPAPSTREQKLFNERFMEWIGEHSHDTQNSEPYQWNCNQQKLLIQPIGALGKTWAYIIFILDRNPQEHDYLILDSASLSIAQDLLRKRYMEERKLYTENLWIDDLLHARLKDEEHIKSFIGSNFNRINKSPFQVCLIEFERDTEKKVEEEWEESIGIHLSLILRSIFEQFSFMPLMTLKNNRLVVIAIDLEQKSKKPSKQRLQQVFDSIQSLNEDEKISSMHLLIGIGSTYTHLTQVHQSYQEAIQAISLYPCYEKNILYFEELGVFQLLFHITDRKVLESFVTGYLGPLLKHDQERGSELVRTLQVFLDHDGSKQLAAQKLFIVRQSLYYRLEKISELLGPEFIQPEKKLALQVALRAFQLLNPGVSYNVKNKHISS